MNKEEYKKSLHRHYPEEPDNVLELAWHFHGMEKAKKYIKVSSINSIYPLVSDSRTL